MNEGDILLQTIFGSDDVQRRSNLLLGKQKLIHYCSAETALRIIKNREIWLRNVRVMNDFMEVNHGFNLITRSLHPAADTAIDTGIRAVQSAINAIHPGLAELAFDRFRAWSPYIQNETYVTCLSEHMEHESDDGRLSMWRNYSSGQAGVGLVISTTMFGTYEDRLGVFSSPVYYHTDQELEQTLFSIAEKIRFGASNLAKIERERIIGYYFMLLRTISHGSKHPGFREEREWRVFHTLNIDPIGKLQIHSESVGGVPQRILKLPLDRSIPGLSVPELIESILIGPSQYQHVIGMALADELRKAGKANEEFKITYSPIPLRT